MKIAIVQPPGRRNHQNVAGESLALGMRRLGDQAILCGIRAVPPDTDAVCAWGWRNSRPFSNAGRNVLVMERAYAGDRFEWTSLGWNGLNGRAVWPARNDASRWNTHFPDAIKPWRLNRDGYALIVGQVPSDAACLHIGFERWARDTAAALRKHGRSVCFRPHPQAPRLQIGVSSAPGEVKYRDDAGLEQALSEAAFVVTFNSNVGVLAALNGTPTVACDIGSMAYSVASHSLSDPIYTPDRTDWARRLAWAQWLPSEMEDGTAWEVVRAAMPGQSTG